MDIKYEPPTKEETEAKRERQEREMQEFCDERLRVVMDGVIIEVEEEPDSE